MYISYQHFASWPLEYRTPTHYRSLYTSLVHHCSICHIFVLTDVKYTYVKFLINHIYLGNIYVKVYIYTFSPFLFDSSTFFSHSWFLPDHLPKSFFLCQVKVDTLTWWQWVSKKVIKKILSQLIHYFFHLFTRHTYTHSHTLSTSPQFIQMTLSSIRLLSYNIGPYTKVTKSELPVLHPYLSADLNPWL